MANLPNNNFTTNTLSLHAGYEYDRQRTISRALIDWNA